MAVSAGGVRRAAVVPLVAAAGLLLASLVSCTGSPEPGASGSSAPGSGGSKPPSSAPPGKFRTLPEACGAVPRSALVRLLPGTGAASPSPEDSGGAGSAGSGEGADGSGEATLTYDTDRRVGCEWSGEGESWNRYLHVDMERVVSYDPSVSDEEQAREEYLDAAGAADVPGGGPGSAPPGSGGASQDGGGGSSSDTASPRIIAGIGDEAFLEDRLKAEAAEPHREVVIVFRKANVIVKVELREWPLDGGPLPSGSTMQVNAHHVAQELARVFNEQ